MEIREIIEKIKTATKPVSSVLSKTDTTTILAIGLGKEVLLKEHKAPGTATILVIKGTIVYQSQEQHTELGIYDSFKIPPEEIHSVVAMEEAVFLIIINKD